MEIDFKDLQKACKYTPDFKLCFFADNTVCEEGKCPLDAKRKE